MNKKLPRVVTLSRRRFGAIFGAFGLSAGAAGCKETIAIGMGLPADAFDGPKDYSPPAPPAPFEQRSFCELYYERFGSYHAFALGRYYGVEHAIDGAQIDLQIFKFPVVRTHDINSDVIGYNPNRTATEVLFKINVEEGRAAKAEFKPRLTLTFDTGERFVVDARIVYRNTYYYRNEQIGRKNSGRYFALSIADCSGICGSLNRARFQGDPQADYDLRDQEADKVAPVVAAMRRASTLTLSVVDMNDGQDFGSTRISLAGVSRGLDTAAAKNAEVMAQEKETHCYIPGNSDMPHGKQTVGAVPFCFLTTACCEAVGLPDECSELQTARRFRDHWLAHQPGGRAEIDHYYAVAPKIVQTIDAQPGATAFWRKLYVTRIIPWVILIKLGFNRQAHRLYRHMVSDLEARVCNRAALDHGLSTPAA